MKKETFDVIGMTCAACQANVTKAVSKLDGVESVDVSLISNTMKVEYDPEKVDSARIEQAVDQIGYQAVLPKQTLKEEDGGMQAQWQARRKRIEDEIHEKKVSLYTSAALLLVLMVFSMLPMLGIFTFLMDMEWMMVSGIIQLILCTFILFFERSFFTHGIKALIRRAPNMDSLVAIGSGASYLYGIYGLLRMAYGYGIMDHHIIHGSMDALYFESAAMILVLVSLGKYLEARSKAKTGDALSKLVDLAPKTALVLKDGVEVEVLASQVVSGDVIVIKPGMAIAVDGIVQSGTGYVDQAAITGESVPVEKQPGDEVMAATINVNGSFRFTATKVGEDTTLAQIIRLVDEAGSSKAPIARLADKVSGIFVPVVFGIAAVTVIGWLLFGQTFSFALNCGICVLVISCPCALGLATPLAIMVSTGKAAENGILVKSAAALETLHNVNTVVLDKTGTITLGKPEVVSVNVLDPSLSEEKLIEVAAEAETGSEHPLGKAIVQKAKAMNLNLQAPDWFEAISGRGLKAHIGSRTICAGNAAYMDDLGIALSPKAQQVLHEASSKGQTPLIFTDEKQLLGIISVADTVRPDSAAALKLLHNMNIETVMLTGDNEKTAKAIASSLAIDRVISDVLPADKESLIRSLQEEGRRVVMVGDGINDAPALMRADVGMAIGAGTDIAVESADIVLMKDSLLDVVTAVDLSRKTITNIRENLFWAFFYNCLGIPVAMGLLYPAFGILLNPMFGAAAMSLSSVTVCLNALRLRLFKPRNETRAEIASLKEPKAAVEKREAEIANMDQDIQRQAEKEEADLAREMQLQTKQDEALQIPVWNLQTAGKDEVSDKPDLFEASIEVEGMSCAHCQKAVEKALLSIKGVEEASVSLETKQASFKADMPIDVKEVQKVIEEAGYEPAQAYTIESRGGKTMEQEMIVAGMSCNHCKARVEKALSAVEGVKKVDVDLASGKTVVTSDQPVDAAALKKAVEDAGYEVK